MSDSKQMCRTRLLRFQVCCVIFILLGCRSIASAQSTDTELRQHFEAARKAQISGNLSTAAHEYQAVLHIQPDIPEVLVNLGLVYYAQSNFAASEAVLRRAAALNPKLRGVDLYLGIDNVKLGHAARAVPYLQRAVQQESKGKEAHAWFATALWDAGMISKSLDQLRATNRLFPSDMDSAFLLAEGYRKASDLQVQRLLKAAAGKPFSDVVYGDIYAEQKSWARAEKHYRRALQEDPRSSSALVGLAVVNLRQNKLTEAKKYLSQDILAKDRSPAASARLAEIDFLEGKPEHGLRLLTAALDLSVGETVRALDIHPSLVAMNENYDEPMRAEMRGSIPALQQMPETAARDLALTMVGARMGLHDDEVHYWTLFNQSGWANQSTKDSSAASATLEYDHENYGEAARELQDWVAIHRNDLKRRYLLSITYSILSRRVVEHMLSSDPGSIRIHQLVAQSYENGGQDYKALDEYRVVASMDHNVPGVHFAMGNLLWKNEQSKDAIVELQKELQINPDHAEANAELGTILVDQHEPAEAVPYLQHALALAPDLTLLHQQLGDAFYMEKQYSKAETELKKALVYDKDGTTHYLLGSVYRSEGDMALAKDEFTIARKLKAEQVKREIRTTDALQSSR